MSLQSERIFFQKANDLLLTASDQEVRDTAKNYPLLYTNIFGIIAAGINNIRYQKLKVTYTKTR